MVVNTCRCVCSKRFPTLSPTKSNQLSSVQKQVAFNCLGGFVGCALPGFSTNESSYNDAQCSPGEKNRY